LFSARLLGSILYAASIIGTLSPAKALKASNENNLVLFGLAVGITALLVGLERFTLWVLARHSTS
ncbi:hypothetical protein QUA40_08580, partial [Microcoleus sp. Pol11C3]|uniref:hypothetical protein n=1 Tax=Microcoleus sp. Pol11C3 TaxID=3055390 RepID=UPI002FD6A121